VVLLPREMNINIIHLGIQIEVMVKVEEVVDEEDEDDAKEEVI
jgi:hypothetical protein